VKHSEAAQEIQEEARSDTRNYGVYLSLLHFGSINDDGEHFYKILENEKYLRRYWVR
jgi:hypothetical protein